MANLYVVVPVAPSQVPAILAALPAEVGRRTEANQIAHYRTNLDGQKIPPGPNPAILLQAELNASELAQLEGVGGVVIGTFDAVTGQASPSVHEYLATNRAAWEGTHD